MDSLNCCHNIQERERTPAFSVMKLMPEKIDTFPVLAHPIILCKSWIRPDSENLRSGILFNADFDTIPENRLSGIDLILQLQRTGLYAV